MDVRRGAEVLAQPTRARLFAQLAELGRPAGTDELARALGLNVNGVRGHLERLREAGLLDRRRERLARGRPRDSWSIRPDANPDGEPPSGYVELARWLTRALAGRSERVVEATGRDVGHELAPQGGRASAEERFFGRLVTLGFQPARRREPDGRLTYVLANCPYRDAVHEDQAVVCCLHRGLTRGLLDVVSRQTELTDFVPKDPYVAGCLIQVRGPLAEEAPVRASSSGGRVGPPRTT